MKRLSELYIEGYKSIKHAQIQFTDINILIGGNGAGKSNLLSFFNMMQRIKEYELQNYVMEQGGINTLLYNGRKQTNDCYFCIRREKYQFYGRIQARSADECFFAQQGVYDYIEGTNYYAADGFSELKDSGSNRWIVCTYAKSEQSCIIESGLLGLIIYSYSYQASGSVPEDWVTRGADLHKSIGQCRPNALGFLSGVVVKHFCNTYG